MFAPLSCLYALIIYLRKKCYQYGLLASYKSPLPVVVVGNITLGGTGKSPAVSYLVKSLQARGYRPGVVSRGYGAKVADTECREVLSTSLPSEVGDEPLMLKRRLSCPVYVSPNRKLSVQALEQQGCDIVICDDGLQHYALQRDIEICVFDGERGLGNAWLLPTGPLRELPARMSSVDHLLVNGADELAGYPQYEFIRMDLRAENLVSLDGEMTSPLASLTGKKVNAVAAIGNPERFFAVLESYGMILNRHAFEDHHDYQQSDFNFSESLPLIMTEKDVVKCGDLKLPDAWYLPVEACLSRDLAEMIVKTL